MKATKSIMACDVLRVVARNSAPWKPDGHLSVFVVVESARIAESGKQQWNATVIKGDNEMEKLKQPVLSVDAWLDYRDFIGAGSPFPMTTDQVHVALGEMGINISEPGINRAVRLAGMVVPKAGHHRAWSKSAFISLWEFITSGETSEPRVRKGSAPVWQKSFVVGFKSMNIAADDFYREWKKCIESPDGSNWLRLPWHRIPAGFVLEIRHDGNILLSEAPGTFA